MTAHPNGYSFNLASNIPNRFRCPLCKLLLRDAVQTFRGELACEVCYNTARQANPSVCPIDGEPIDDSQIFQDKHARRMVLQLPCYCKNKEHGCVWEGVVQDAANHETECEFSRIPCPVCKEVILKRNMTHHQKQECILRKEKCQFCLKEFVARDLQDHESQCSKRPRKCPYDCGILMHQSDLYNHVKTCASLEKGEECPYKPLGCMQKVSGKQNLEQHLIEDTFAHAALSLGVVNAIQEENEAFKRQLKKEIVLRKEMEKKIEQQIKDQQPLQEDFTKLQERLHDIQKEYAALKVDVETKKNEMAEEMKKQPSQNPEEFFKPIQDTYDQYGKKYDDFERKIKRLDSSARSSGVQSSASEVMNLRRDIDACSTKIEMIETNNAVLSANVSDLELKLQLLENTSYNGRHIWKVDNLRHRMQQAVTGKITALHSAPCYTSRTGYKFCCRLYLNGDGMGKGSHLSLFFVVMRSEYDALLSWPFKHRVTFRLINPENDSESVRESFLPDRNSSSFKRPTRDMNIAAGCPMFMSKDAITAKNFVLDDCLYIETSVTQT